MEVRILKVKEEWEKTQREEVWMGLTAYTFIGDLATGYNHALSVEALIHWEEDVHNWWLGKLPIRQLEWSWLSPVPEEVELKEILPLIFDFLEKEKAA